MPLYRFSSMYMIGLIAMALLLLMLVFPVQVLEASLNGLSIWWDVLFPALFPFFVISEMMLGLGIVHFFGMLFDPLMRPVFRIPGIGGFILAMGFAAGYPVGAKLTSQLWEQKLVNRDEGERLVAFTTTSDPIFLIGAVSVGFFHDASLAVILAVAHYGTAFIIGFLMRFHGEHATSTSLQAASLAASTAPPAPPRTIRQFGSQAFEAMHTARLRDGRSLGQMLSQAIRSSIQLVMVIGGLVVFFAVVMEMMSSAHLMQALYIGLDAILHLLGLPTALSPAVAGGLFEVTLGAKAAGAADTSISLMHKTAIAAFILSWAGLSVHAQVVSLLQHTNLRYLPFCMARMLHGLLAAMAVLLLWKPLQGYRDLPAAAFFNKIDTISSIPELWGNMVTWNVVAFLSILLCLILFYALHIAVKHCMKWLK
ncbi:sporulation integral membrane protein YlbJ [Paenibacillus agricola]|uniref:Sporulation integral membrane protein YlbJ n=1 Tax=Paenibacillus agricola TaxID=2716264 RepID=A0ABX0JHZ6_9BACL|nr:sporulation integral membrane protein YlbJ [Paenibacillus agricola]NHN33491.1 sporulation integral membrane protein YlbJ [Paenibacillus agricola]